MNRTSRAPLAGRTVVVTRAEGQDGPLSRRLEALGARVLNWPTIAFAEPSDPGVLEEALARLDDYHWVLFTSPRAVDAVRKHAAAHRPGKGRPRVAAVGAATAGALAEAGWPVDLVPERYEGRELVAALAEAGLKAGERVLLPAGSLARSTVPDGLTERGVVVDRVEAYRTLPASLEPLEIRRQLESGEMDVITFASPSAVSGLAEAVGAALLRRILARIPAAVIGPVTAEAVRAAGGRRVIESGANDLDGLAAAAVQAGQPYTPEP